ncbi:BMT4 [Candida jiufengensis]|uniref:BMT4 n=1 Tax=Candida jiufengensis TaxID=497108 RepID=UPI002224B887|nr:BMT4 [Candida jiufengensis]KAI5951253.1 BMT4 [Candida jiufengensis]
MSSILSQFSYFDGSTQIYIISASIITPLSFIVIFKNFKRYKKTNELSTILINTCLIILNFNAWVFLVWSLRQNQERLNKTPLQREILDLKFQNVNIPGFSFLNYQDNVVSNSNEDDSKLEEKFSCSSIQNSNQVSIEASELVDLNKEGDLRFIRNQLKDLSPNNKAYQLCFQDGEHQSEDDILKKKWFKFCGSAVWMSKYQVYFMVSRVIYSRNARKNLPTISILYGQIFDKNWKELKHYKFPNSELIFPTILPHEIDLGKRTKKEVLGSEDPRIILNEYIKDGELFQEPVIVFSSRRTEINWARAMHTYQPLTNSKKITRMAIKDKKRSFIEKNWAPFFDRNKDDDNGKYINFIYNFNPLRIIKCDLQNGECNKVSGPPFNSISANDNAGKLRGGTNIIEIPIEFLPTNNLTNDRKYWIGIGRSHINSCGCLQELYRPHIFLMSRLKTKTESFQLDYVSSLIDFNINPESWYERKIPKSTCQDGKSVLIPNSISYWEFNNKENIDYMGITFSEADRTNKLLHVRGLLKHIHNLFEITNGDQKLGNDENNNQDNNQDQFEKDEKSKLLGECSTFLSNDYCENTKKLLNW